MRYIRDTNNSNTIVGIFLLIVLAVFAGPNALPRLLSSILPIADEGIPCTWLRESTQRDRHQSLIGRASSTIPGNPPISIRAVLAPLPNDSAGEWVIRIIMSNDSIGTIPVVINPFPSVIDNGQAGAGVSFTTAPINAGSGQLPAGNAIRVLGPRQRCVQRITIPASQLPSLGVNAGTTVKAYYRNGTPGATGAGAIYPDQGLWVGVIESPLESISFSAGT